MMAGTHSYAIQRVVSKVSIFTGKAVELRSWLAALKKGTRLQTNRFRASQLGPRFLWRNRIRVDRLIFGRPHRCVQHRVAWIIIRPVWRICELYRFSKGLNENEIDSSRTRHNCNKNALEQNLKKYFLRQTEIMIRNWN